MSYIIMAIQEEGSETRVSDFDKHERGFDTPEAAASFLDKARDYYPEFRQFWVEEFKDTSYYMERMSRSEFTYYDEDY